VRTLNVLVTGGCGYVGSALIQNLADDGRFTVISIDNGLTATTRVEHPAVTYVDGDVRDTESWRTLLTGIDSVVHLAAVVGDPACGLDAQLAWEINYLGTVRLAEACRKAGVRRFVFASTCSNYGLSRDAAADIDSPLHPQSDYAGSKIHAEHYLLTNRDESFSTCILRFATLYGLAPRMRFDLAVNTMTAMAVSEGRVMVHGGTQWRPFLHVRDAAKALRLALTTAHRRNVPEVYNCGHGEENYRIIDIAHLIKRMVPETEIAMSAGNTDSRDYRVNFERIHRDLSFEPEMRVATGIQEIVAAMDSGGYQDWAGHRYSDVKAVERSLAQGETASSRRFSYSWPRFGTTKVA
jgi:nucleoside-diphosphate-sugar epimerase